MLNICKAAMVPSVKLLLLMVSFTVKASESVRRGEVDRIFKPGDAIIGGLLPLHRRSSKNGCENAFLPGINRVEAVLYAVDQINKDNNILTNISLGYDIRDYCMDRAKAMQHTHDFSTHLHLLMPEGGGSTYKSNFVTSCNGTCDACVQCKTSNVDATKPVAAIVGPYGSRFSLQVAGLLQVVNIPAISPSASSPELSWSFYSKFLRAVPPDKFQAEAMADLIEFFAWSYVAVIAVEDSYGLYGFRALEHLSLERETFCIGLVQYITPKSYESWLKPIVKKLKMADNIKVIVLWLGDTIAKDLTREALRQNLSDRVWLMSDSLSTKTPAFLGPEMMSLGAYLGVQPRKFDSRNYEHYLRNLTPKIRTNQTDTNPWFDTVWRQQDNCSTEIDKGYGPCPEDLRISKDLYMKMSDDFIPYQIDSIYAIAHALDMIYRCEEPMGLLPNGACPQTKPFVSPADVLLYLRNVSFKGLTGKIEFNENGDPLQAAYDFVSFQRSYDNSAASGGKHTKVKIGEWDAKGHPKIKVNASVILWSYKSKQFPSGTANVFPTSECLEKCPAGKRQTPTVACCWQCLECPQDEVNALTGSTTCLKCNQTQKANTNKTLCLELPIENMVWDSVAGITLMAFTILGFVLTFFTFIVFMQHYRSPIVRAANRELSLVLLANIAIGFGLPIITISKPTWLICVVIEPWRYITSSLSVSLLLIKTVKLLRAFQVKYVAKWLKKTSGSATGQLICVILLNLSEFILAILWAFLDTPYEATVIEKGKYILNTCRPHETALGRVLDVTMLVYLILLSFLCSFYAFKARSLPENFNEARFIAFVMYIHLLSWITFYPMRWSMEGWFVAMVSCTTALICSYGLLACIFSPKVFVILRYPEQNTIEFMRNELRRVNTTSVAPANEN
ncbi:extracellular calcium-sensing receptor-like [Acropora millepora]|uniref:extracellular calcium-sensing receptor-like n=1 Tax=Acropora millepora TaxID=45264 RepID=UPI001CF51E68|nr:extracellular calcium-sensing receptor-like [Acropora millepora]XP_029186445.2 extracellular calcium-sensing receptor-like [Acropora millepora]